MWSRSKRVKKMGYKILYLLDICAETIEYCATLRSYNIIFLALFRSDKFNSFVREHSIYENKYACMHREFFLTTSPDYKVVYPLKGKPIEFMCSVILLY